MSTLPSAKSTGSMPIRESTAHHRFIMENISVYSAIPVNDRGHGTVSEANITQRIYIEAATLCLHHINFNVTYSRMGKVIYETI